MTIERKGWCPDLRHPMESGDGFLVNVKPPLGRIDADDARVLAAAAKAHGNGIIEITNRANLQFRGLTPESAARFAEVVQDMGHCAAHSVEARRNIIVSPLGAADPTAAFDSHEIARALETRIAAESGLGELPAKFGFLVDGGGALSLAGVTADVECRAAGEMMVIGLPESAVAVPCPPSGAAAHMCRLAFAFLELSRTQASPPRRMRALVRLVGADAVFAAAGLKADIAMSPPDVERRAPIGRIALGDRYAFALGLPFGQLQSGRLTQIAGIAEEFGDGLLRFAPWRAVIVAGIPSERLAGFEAKAFEAGALTDPADPRTRISACAGRLCQSAHADARTDAERLAKILKTEVSALHVSGCAKGCAHPAPAEITLVGRNGGYDLIRDGGAGDRPLVRGLSLDQAASWIDAR